MKTSQRKSTKQAKPDSEINEFLEKSLQENQALKKILKGLKKEKPGNNDTDTTEVNRKH